MSNRFFNKYTLFSLTGALSLALLTACGSKKNDSNNSSLNNGGINNGGFATGNCVDATRPLALGGTAIVDSLDNVRLQGSTGVGYGSEPAQIPGGYRYAYGYAGDFHVNFGIVQGSSVPMTMNVRLSSMVIQYIQATLSSYAPIYPQNGYNYGVGVTQASNVEIQLSRTSGQLPTNEQRQLNYVGLQITASSCSGQGGPSVPINLY